MKQKIYGNSYTTIPCPKPATEGKKEKKMFSDKKYFYNFEVP